MTIHPENQNSKEGIIIEKASPKEQKTSPDKEQISMEGPWQIYDRIFKRIFSLSNTSIIHLINGLFGTDFPLDSSVKYPNKEFVFSNLEHRIADVIVIINGTYAFHLEAQMTKDNMIVLRVFEYSFLFAMSTQSSADHLDFPEPAVIYLDNTDDIPEESILHISFGSQGNFDYHVKNFIYLAHSTEELNQQKMVILIPFQVLRLRSLLRQWKQCKKKEKNFDNQKIYQLQEEIRDDIINSIKLNFSLSNITADDARQLTELTNLMYEHICKDFISSGGEKNMNPLLHGAIELPNDKYRFRIDELEKQVKWYADKISEYADENTRYADENTRYANENIELKKRIAELEAQVHST